MKNNVYPCKPQFYYKKVGFKGVKIIEACFRDEYMDIQWMKQSHLFVFNKVCTHNAELM